MTNAKGRRVAVIGAGLAGLCAADALGTAGADVTILEKSRGVGGRLATRRDGEGGAGFDHGAQYVTARDAAFERYVARAVGADAAAEWAPTRIETAETPKRRFVGAPGMRGLTGPLVADIEKRGGRFLFDAEASAARRTPEGWRIDVQGAADAADTFDAVILSAPAPQAARIAAAFPELVAALERVDMAPCWALMLATGAPWAGPADIARDAAADIAWLARDSSKPGRAADGVERWVAHAGERWTEDHLELEKEAAAAALLERIAAQFGPPPASARATAHRWRFARVRAPLGQPFLAAEAPGLVLCGDWCLGPRAEAAFMSGAAAAAALIDQL